MSSYDIRRESAPTLKAIADLVEGDTLYVFHGADDRPDWGAYLAAIGDAWWAGVRVVWTSKGEQR